MELDVLAPVYRHVTNCWDFAEASRWAEAQCLSAACCLIEGPAQSAVWTAGSWTVAGTVTHRDEPVSSIFVIISFQGQCPKNYICISINFNYTFEGKYISPQFTRICWYSKYLLPLLQFLCHFSFSCFYSFQATDYRLLQRWEITNTTVLK